MTLDIILGLLKLDSGNEDKTYISHALLGKNAYCPSRCIQTGHNAKIGAFRVSDSGQIWVRLDFQILNKMSAWCKIEELES